MERNIVEDNQQLREDIIILENREQKVLQALRNLPTCQLEKGKMIAERESGILVSWFVIQNLIKQIEGGKILSA